MERIPEETVRALVETFKDSGDTEIGVYLCSCKGIISKGIDFERLEGFLREKGNIAFVGRHDSLCSENGLVRIREAIHDFGLDSMLVVGCESNDKRSLFQEEAEKMGINPLSVDMVDIRERCALVHPGQPKEATKKAKLLIWGGIAKARKSGELKSISPVPVTLNRPIARRDLLRSVFRLFREYRVSAVVDQSKCGESQLTCQHCITTCPVGAMDRGRTGLVREDSCQACGVCVPACPLGAITLPGHTQDQLLDQLRAIFAGEGEDPGPMVVVFSCSLGRPDPTLEAGKKNLSYSTKSVILQVPCIGMISEIEILKSIELGARGVLVLGCPTKGCQFEHGAELTKARCSNVRNLLRAFNLDDDSVLFVNTGGDPTKLVQIIDATVERAVDMSHQFRRVTGDVPLPTSRREAFLNLLDAFSDRLEVVPLIEDEYQDSTFAKVRIDESMCTLCGICTAKCPTSAIMRADNGDSATLDFIHVRCTNCGLCASLCPEDAIRIERGLDVRKLTERSPEMIFRQRLIACARCGEFFLPASVLDKLYGKIYEASTVGREPFLKLCSKCRTSRMLSGEG